MFLQSVADGKEARSWQAPEGSNVGFHKVVLAPERPSPVGEKPRRRDRRMKSPEVPILRGADFHQDGESVDAVADRSTPVSADLRVLGREQLEKRDQCTVL